VKNSSRPAKKGTLGIEHAYHSFFSQYGRVAIVTPDELPGERHLDLLVLPGGADLSTAFQKNTFTLDSGSDNVAFTQFYNNSFSKWVGKVPIFGICLGMQAINKMLGGTITPHGIGHQLEDDGLHGIAYYSNKSSGLVLGGTVGATTKVNSRHHQFIRHQDLAECLFPVAFGASHTNRNVTTALLGQSTCPLEVFKEYYYDRTPEKLHKISPLNTHIEAYTHFELPIGAVQWHPEDLFQRGDAFTRGDLVSHKIIEWLLNWTESEGVEIPVEAKEGPMNKVKHLEGVIFDEFSSNVDFLGFVDEKEED